MKLRILTMLSFLLMFSMSAMANPYIYKMRPPNKMSGLEGFVAPGPVPKALLSYYGGPVLSNASVYAVYWGPNVNPEVTAKIPDFYKSFIESNYMDWLTEYNTVGVKSINGHVSTNQVIGRGKYEGVIVLQPINKSMSVTDTEIRAEIDAQINAGKLPNPNANTLFMLHMPPGMSITYDTLPGGGVSCQDYCAYHSDYHRPADGSFVYYGVMPDYSQGMCAPPHCGSGTAFENFTSATSHELTESVTDPAGDDVKSGADWPMAWLDSSGGSQGEIGDICSYNSPNGKIFSSQDGTPYVVQGEWSNTRNQCYQGPNGG